MINVAREYAIQKHGDQKYGEKPYSYHLDSVVALLSSYGEKAQIIGYLHDVVEDTQVTLAEVEKEFGSDVASAVGVLTDQPGSIRKERKQKTYEFMATVKGDLEIALLVKTADRLANLMACIEHCRDDKLQMYKSEHAQFKQAVYRQGLCDELWAKIDEVFA